MSGRAALPQLLLDEYTPFTFDYSSIATMSDGEEMSLTGWLQVFRSSIPSFKRQSIKGSSGEDAEKLQEQADDFERRFEAVLKALAADAKADIGYDTGPYPTHCNCASLCRARDLCVADAGFTGDVFRDVKAQENSEALKFLAEVVQELDKVQDPDERWELAVRGVFAGNIFDLGAAASEELYAAGGSSFQKTRSSLQGRPWVVDDLDKLVERMRGQAHYKAVLFVDNAGSDVVLGMLPFARELLRRGTRVIIAANEVPTINDITAEELKAIMPEVCKADPEILGRTWASGQLSVMHNGSDLPVIDLTRLSTELCEAAADADLVVLEGMGRSIETNLRAEFVCDVINLGMIKHREVASLLGGQLYGCVCRFEPGASHLPLWQNLLTAEGEGTCDTAELKASVVWPPVARKFPNSDNPGGEQDLLGEGPVWCHEQGALYWIDIPRPAVHRLHLGTGCHVAGQVSDWVGCIGLWGGHKAEVGEKRLLEEAEADEVPKLVAAVGPHLVGLVLPTTEILPGSSTTCMPVEGTTRLARVIPQELEGHLCLNDGKPDARGNLWFGSAHKPGSSLAAKASEYRPVKGTSVPGAMEVDPNGNPPLGSFYVTTRGALPNDGVEVSIETVEEAGPVTVSNGLGWSPDNTTMYTTDSPARCVRAWDFDIASSKISRPRIFCGVPEALPAAAVPDGLAVDANGDVWVAFWDGGAVGCFAKETGALSVLLRLPVTRPTCVAFGGAELDVLFVTSCRQDKLEDRDLARLPDGHAEPLAGCVFAIYNAGKGLPSNRFSA